jgi:hypothetical protein
MSLLCLLRLLGRYSSIREVKPVAMLCQSELDHRWRRPVTIKGWMPSAVAKADASSVHVTPASMACWTCWSAAYLSSMEPPNASSTTHATHWET